MRLINTKTLDMVMFPDGPPASSSDKRYAILSHRWGPEEISLEDYSNVCHSPSAVETDEIERRSGYKKVVDCCAYARHRGIRWVWVDTCCIDKRSSSELSESINSMWTWYSEAYECYVYLADISEQPHQSEAAMRRFRASSWFTRAWTLQELIAPTKLVFCTQTWKMFGEIQKTPEPPTKSLLGNAGIVEEVSSITNIPKEYLLSTDLWRKASIAQKMRWASRRKATRAEDTAYSLLGLFDVNMPLLYGEKQDKAFMRLQEKIIARSDDESIFVWKDIESGNLDEGRLLAPSPMAFINSDHVLCSELATTRAPHSVTGKGLQMESEYRIARMEQSRSDETMDDDQTPRADIFLVKLNCEILNPDGIRQRCELALKSETSERAGGSSSARGCFLRYNETLHGHEVSMFAKQVSSELPPRSFSVRLAKRENIFLDQMVAIEHRRLIDACYGITQKLADARYSADPALRKWFTHEYTILDIDQVVQSAGTRHQETTKGEAVKLMAVFSQAVLCYANVVNFMARKDHNCVSLTWGTVKLLFVLSEGSVDSMVDFVRSMIQVAKVLPRVHIDIRSHDVPIIRSAIEELYALLMGHLRRRLELFLDPGSGDDGVITNSMRNKEFRNLLNRIDRSARSIENMITVCLPGDHQGVHVLLSSIYPENGGSSSRQQQQQHLENRRQMVLDLATQHQRDVFVTDTLAFGTIMSEQARQTLQEERLEYIVCLASETPMSDSADTLRMRLSLCRGSSLQNKHDLRMVWRSSVLSQWSISKESQTLVIRGSLTLRREIGAVGSLMTDLLRASGVPALWALQTAGTQPRSNPTPAQILRHMAKQALVQEVDSVSRSTFDTLSLDRLANTVDGDQWVKIIAWAIKRNPLVYVVVDMTLLANTGSTGEDVSMLRNYLEGLVLACMPTTVLKILLIEQSPVRKMGRQSSGDRVLDLNKVFQPGPQRPNGPHGTSGLSMGHGRGDPLSTIRSQLSSQASQSRLANRVRDSKT